MSKKPVVAIVGRMNVGKSTLFNRLTESQEAITSSWAGTTRDVNYGDVLWRGHEIQIVDTGGMDVEDDEQLEERVIAAARRTIGEADMVLFVIDGRAGVLPQDKDLADEVRKSGKPTLLVVNKIDSTQHEQNAMAEIHSLHFENVAYVSAKNGRGSGDMLDQVYDILKPDNAADVEVRRTKVAIVGRPNVGKSSLLNAILGEDRVIVADLAHTTRDSNDIPYTYKDHDFMLIDTAGMRRRKKVGKKWDDGRLGAIEKKSVQGSIDAIKRADVVLLVIEAQKRITAQDKKIIDLANEHGKGLVLLINKWDLIPEKDSNTINDFTDYFDQALPFLRWAPMMFISALDRLRVEETLDMVLEVSDNYHREIDQEILNAVLEKARRYYRPKPSKMRKYRVKPAVFNSFTQTGTKPPRFLLKAKNSKNVPKAIRQIMEKELRHLVNLHGVRVIIEIE